MQGDTTGMPNRSSKAIANCSSSAIAVRPRQEQLRFGFTDSFKHLIHYQTCAFSRISSSFLRRAAARWRAICAAEREMVASGLAGTVTMLNPTPLSEGHLEPTGGRPRHRKWDSDAGGPRCCSRSAMGRAS